VRKLIVLLAVFLLGQLSVAWPIAKKVSRLEGEIRVWKGQVEVWQSLANTCAAGLEVCSVMCEQKAGRMERFREGGK
jgi:hypothetical protein